MLSFELGLISGGLTGGVLFTVAILSYLTFFIRQIYWHRLSKYPGPLFAKVSDIAYVIHVYRGDSHTYLAGLHQKFGRVVRIGPNKLSFKSAAALKDIYGHGSTLIKDDSFYAAFSAVPGKYNTHNSTSKPEHARKRRVLSHAFSETALKGMEDLMIKHVDQLCGYMQSVPGPKNMAKWYNYLTYDVMGELCFGQGFSMKTDDSSRYLVGFIDKVSHASCIAGSYPLIKKLRLHFILLASLAKQRWQFMLYARTQADQRMAKEIDFQKDFFFYLLRAKDPETGQGFEVGELWEEAAMLMVAGSDTTSTALASTTHYMVKNSQCLAEATKEVRDTFKDLDEIVHGPALSSCVYLRCCIDEGLRLCPPVPGYLPRKITRDGTTIDGESLLAGTTVGVPCWALQRDELYYPAPTEFRPTRWTHDSEAQRELAKSAYAPFSIGPRGCIGKSLALMESRIALARILWQYDLKPTKPLSRSYDIEDHFTAQKSGPDLEFVKRRD